MLRRCLEKDPKRRLRDIADARLDLDEQDVAAAAAPAPPRRRWLTYERLAWALVSATLAILLGYTLQREPPSPVPVRFQVHAPEQGFLGSDSGVGRADGTSGAALSSDGTQLAYVATDQSGRTTLWLRRLDAFTSRPLPGTEDGLMPFWSPDGRSIGFFADGKVKTVTVADGATQTIASVGTPPRGGSWGRDDVILFSGETPPQFARISPRGGTTTTISLATGQAFPRWPWFLPDGRHFLFVGTTIRSDDSRIRPGIYVGSIEPGFEPKRIAESDGYGVFVAPGYLLFTQGDVLLQQPFDLKRLQLTGETTPLGVQFYDSSGVNRGDFTASQTGVLAYRSVINQSNQFAWFDRTGKLLESVGSPGLYRTHDLSPDGTQLVYTDVNQGDLWILDMARQTTSRFTSGPGTETAPAWFPDGTKIAYRRDGGGMFEKDVGGTATERTLFTGPVNGPMQVSRDGKWLLYFAVVPSGTQDIFVLPTSGERTPKAIVESPFPDVEPQLSPDGRWLAYASSETGRNEIYVQPFPTTGRRWQVSSRGGRQPLKAFDAELAQPLWF